MFNLDWSAKRDGLVKAKSIVVFNVSCLRLNLLLGPNPFKYWITDPTFQNDKYLGCGVLEWKTPFRSLQLATAGSAGWLPTPTPSTFSWVNDIADQYEFKDQASEKIR